MKDLEKKKESLISAQRAFFIVWAIIGGLGVIYALGQVLNVLSIPVGILGWTLIIVFCLRGMVNKFEAKGLNRAMGTTLAYVIMFVVLTLIVVLMTSPLFGIGDQFANLIASIPSLVQDVIAWINQFYSQYATVLDNETIRAYLQDVLNAFGAAAQDLARSSAGSVMALGGGVVSTFTVLGFAMVVAFWILLELPALGREVNRLVSPKYRDDVQMLHVTFTRVVGGYIRATLLQCAVIGVACGILFAVVGIPNAIALGVITGLLNIIPIIGPWLGGALAAAVGLFASPMAALIAVVGAILVQQFVYTFVSPRFMADAVDIHPALTLVVMMAGSAIGGATGGLVGSLVGMLISIPATAVIKSVFVYYFEKNTGRQLIAEDGVFFQGTPSEGEGVDPIADATSLHPDATARIDKIEARRADGTAPDLSGLLKRVAPPKKDADAEGEEAEPQGESRSGSTGELPSVTEPIPTPEATTRGLDRVVMDE
ncbi:MAG: AI-2E family transporter [Coriobacteriia bacterium]|nr:AI-2E family transporter [Coriobacteriia bacterium]